MIKKIMLVIATVVFFMIFLVNFPSLAIAQEELEYIFRDKMVSEYSEEAYTSFEEKIRSLQGWLTEERMLERVKKDTTFILMYERILRWVETGQLKEPEPGEQEARELLQMNFDRFIDSSHNILEEVMITATLMEKLEVNRSLNQYQDFIWKVAGLPEVKNLLLVKETEILVEMGNTPSHSRKLLERPWEPTRIVESERIRVVLSKRSKDLIQKMQKILNSGMNLLYQSPK